MKKISMILTFAIVAVFLLSSSNVYANPPCFSWDEYVSEGGPAESLVILQAPVVDGEIVPGSEFVAVGDIATTETSACAAEDITVNTAFWIIAVGDNGNESAPSNPVILWVRELPELYERKTSPTGFSEK